MIPKLKQSSESSQYDKTIKSSTKYDNTIRNSPVAIEMNVTMWHKKTQEQEVYIRY